MCTDVYPEVVVHRTLDTTSVTTARGQWNKPCYIGTMECHPGATREWETYMLVSCMSIVKYLGLQVAETNSEGVKKKWNELEQCELVPRMAGRLASRRGLATAAHSASGLPPSPCLGVCSALQMGLQSLSHWGGGSLGHIPNSGLPQDKGHDFHPHKEYAKWDRGASPK